MYKNEFYQWNFKLLFINVPMARISLPTIKVNRAIVDDIFHYMIKIIFQSNIHYYIKLFTSLRNKQDTVPDKLIKKIIHI